MEMASSEALTEGGGRGAEGRGPSETRGELNLDVTGAVGVKDMAKIRLMDGWVVERLTPGAHGHRWTVLVGLWPG